MTAPSKGDAETRAVFKNALVYINSIDPVEQLRQLGERFNPLEWELRDVADDSLFRTMETAPGPWHDHFLLVFESIAQAREVLPLLTVEGVAKRITVMIALYSDATLPFQPQSPKLSMGQSLHVYEVGESPTHVVVDMKGSIWASVHKAVASILSYGPADMRKLPANGLRMGISNLRSSVWAVGDPLARWIDPTKELTDLPPVNSVDAIPEQVLGLTGKGDANPNCDVPSIGGAIVLPPIDPFIISPSGFNPFPNNGDVDLEIENAILWKLIYQGKEIGQGMASLNEGALSKLRNFRSVKIKTTGKESNWVVARMISQLSAAGVPISQFPKNPEIADLLGIELFSVLVSASKAPASTSVRESWSIRVRREALRAFLPRQRLTRLGLSGQLGAFEWPSVSIVLATMRPALVPQILEQIARQSYSSVEIVLAFHGVEDLSEKIKSSINSFPGELICLFFGREITFGEVLNQACRAASGELVTKMDDDDWYGESHIMDLVLARQYSGATLVGSPVEFVFLGGLDVTVRRSHFGERYTDHVAGGTMMLSKNDLVQLGGWRKISSAVDRGLTDAVLASENTVYRTHGQNYVMHRRSKVLGSSDHTWDADFSVFLRDLKEQWDGFVLPPEFLYRYPEYLLNERSSGFQSLFTNEKRE